MRVDLRDGQWVELREHITHAQDKEITRATRAARAEPIERAGEADTTALRVFIADWEMKDPDGRSIPLDDGDAIDRMPSDIADQLIGLITPILYPQATVPNSPTPSSSSDSPSATA